MTTPTDGEWMSAIEALEFLQLPQDDAMKAICDRAQVGLIKARTKLLISEGKKRRDVEVPRVFWWPQGSAVLTVNWLLGDFETSHRTPSERRKAFGVTFRRTGSWIGTPSDAEPPADHGAVAE
jgi:hypothetical protein